MKLLLDTHILLWWLSNDKLLSKTAVETISSPDNFVFVSTASIWEIGIKEALGKVSVPKNLLEAIKEDSFEFLPISETHADEVRNLKDHHKDPFDRMLVVQAKAEGLHLISHDQIFKKYNVELVLV